MQHDSVEDNSRQRIERLHLEIHINICDLCTRASVTMSTCRKSKERKRRQRKRGGERSHQLRLALEESKSTLQREQRVKKVLQRYLNEGGEEVCLKNSGPPSVRLTVVWERGRAPQTCEGTVRLSKIKFSLYIGKIYI